MSPEKLKTLAENRNTSRTSASKSWVCSFINMVGDNESIASSEAAPFLQRSILTRVGHRVFTFFWRPRHSLCFFSSEHLLWACTSTARTHVCVCICVNVYVCMRVSVCQSVYMCIFVRVCRHKRMCLCMQFTYIFMFVYTRAYVRACTCARM